MSAFKLNLADLQFVLRQIKVAEANSTAHSGANAVALTSVWVDLAGNVVPAGTSGAQLAIPDAHVPVGLRTVDGSFNNLVPGREQWGAADNPMPRLLDGSYLHDTDNEVFAPGGPPVTNNNYGVSGNVVDSDPRTISNLIVDMSINNPAAIIAALTFAGSEDPHGDMLRLQDARITQTEADVALALAETAVLTAQTALGIAVVGYVPGVTATIDALQNAAAALTEAEDARDQAQLVADDPDAAFLALAEEMGLTVSPNGTLSIPNVAPDEGLSAPFNAWMTFFGQFFDHGLDLIAKGGGTIYIPLQSDDPLYDHTPGARTNFMVLTRAVPDEGSQTNTTTPFVDQNQTYTSHASHQLFLREYRLDANNRPVATGDLLNGANNGLPTWKDIKDQAREVLGIELTDRDVLNIPLLRTDAYGEFIRGPNGLPQLILGVGVDGIPNTADDIVVEGSLANPVNTFTVTSGALTGAIRIGHAFLDDIAHNAVPGTMYDPDGSAGPLGETMVQGDGDTLTGNAIGADFRGRPTAYDNELLDRHFITGDGRGNENIGLTAVHHIFHSEHNRQVDQQRLTILQSGDLAFINEWLATDIAGLPPGFANMTALNQLAYAETLNWDGERLFQAARFATEMQYQHLVFEEFARKIQPNIDPFVFNNITDINPAIFSEFANTVYRFGHSMLTDSMPRVHLNEDGSFDTSDDMGLIASFLNPVAFNNNNSITDDQAAGALVRGMTVERGNEIDEFIVGALRNSLLGLPLDLAAINIARGRDTGIPTLNDAREQLFAATGSTFLKPYDNWVDFAANLKNPISVVNFIAAYGTHESITSATTLAAKREAAMALVFGIGDDVPEDRVDFLNGTGDWAGDETGLNLIDLWIGGLAEKKMPFGGFLGSTFNAVFEAQLENLQDGDRLYYLTRTQGQNFLNMLEQNSFAKLIMANTDIALEGADGIRGTADDVISRHIGVDAFAAYDYVFEVNKANQAEDDPVGNDPVLEAMGLGKVQRDDPTTALDESLPDTSGNDVQNQATGHYFRFTGGEHTVVGGTIGNDTIITDFGDDGIWGDAGDDRIESGAGVDLVNGGSGNDIITDSGDTGDFLKGDEGDDVIANSNGLDIIMGGTGKDAIFVGVDDTEVFGGEGNDFIAGGEGVDLLMGNEGDDWMEGAGGFDTLAGDNSELFFNSRILGHDVMFAGNEEQDFDAESGDDIMVQGESVIRNEGMFGFDWAIFKGVPIDGYADMRIPIFTTEQEDVLRNRFDGVEGLSGWNGDDTLIGDDRVFGEILPGDTVATTENIFFNDGLSQAGIDRIAGLGALVQRILDESPNVGAEGPILFDRGNFILGGAGSDSLRGNGGDDYLDGDNWLNVRIRITERGEGNTQANQIATVDTLRHVFPAGFSFVDGNGATVTSWAGRSLFDLLLAREIVPEQMHIVREIVTPAFNPADVDIAYYNDIRNNYTVTPNADGTVTITHNTVTNAIDPLTERPIVSDGVDVLRNVEFARFSDGVQVRLTNAPATGAPTISGIEQNLTASTAGIADLNGVPNTFTYQWQSSTTGNHAGAWTNVGANSPNFTVPTNNNLFYRVIVSFTDNDGFAESVTSQITALVGDDNGGAVNDNLTGTNDPNLINGRNGNDTLNGAGGNDVIHGNDDNDTLIGGLGDDLLDGGADTDTASYAAAASAVNVNLATGLATGGDGNDTLVSIENAIGSAFNDTLTGSNGNNALQGGAGNDTYNIDIADGDDTIQEANGIDTLNIVAAGAALTTLNFAEGTGDNLDIDVGATEITVTDHFETAGEVVETVTFDSGTYVGYALAGTYALSADDDGDRTAAAGVGTVLSGDGGNNVLTGSSGRDILFGNGGTDTLNGGAGDDLLIGGTGTDTMRGEAGNDTIVYDINGGGANETITGGDNTDTLAVIDGSGGGTDLSVTYTAGTRINGLEAIAALNADVERVTADLGAGTDSLTYSATSAAVTVNLAAGTATGFASIANIENVNGTNNNDTFTGNGANNAFAGGNGNDTYNFGIADGDDTIQETGGTDTINIVTGGAALAALNFAEGAGDNLDIDVGATEITVTDHFDAAGEVIETVTFDNGSFAGYALAGTYALSADDDQPRTAAAGVATVLSGDGAANTLTGSTNRDMLFGNAGTDTLSGGAGNDLLVGGDGNDIVNGEAGDDTIVWATGDDRDTIDGGADNDTFVINGDPGDNETFRIYTRTAWVNLGGGRTAGANTEIVITRDGTANGNIIAELDNIEEIVINTQTASPPGGPVNGTLGGDTIQVFGNFGTTSLNLSTITVNGGAGDDVVDVTGLQSAHRILFRSNGGNDTIVGNIRPQDVVELAPGTDVSGYTLESNGNGTSTLSNGTHSITFTGPVPPQFQNTPPAPGNDEGVSGAFEYTASDLEGLAALVRGQVPAGAGDDDVPTGVRNVSGYGNNVDNPTWGAADAPFIRITDAYYGAPDANGNRAINPVFANLDPRTISNILGTQEADLPHAGNDANIFFMAMGQYIDHGLDFLGKGGNGTIQIGAPGGGGSPTNPADLTRGTVSGYEDGVPQHINRTSPFVDQNQAYGSNSLVGQFLRAGDGNGGLGAHLFQGAPDPSNPTMNLLPTLRELILEHWENNTVFQLPNGGSIAFRDQFPGLVNGGVVEPAVLASSGMVSNFMGSNHALLLDANPFINQLDHYVAGDGRANENFALTSIHTIWARNHNFHVEGLEAAGFQGTAEELFQAAKMLNEAEYQRVVFDEYLETLLGGLRSEGTHGFEAYDPNANPAISHEFAAAVFRFGHSLIGQTMTVLDANGNPTQVSLFDAFLNPSNNAGVFTQPLPVLQQFGYNPQPGYAQHGVNGIVGGIVSQPAEEVDFNIVNAVRNDLVRISADLFAFNVARGWDVGLGTLNQVRADLSASTDRYVMEAVGFAGGDLTPYTSWEDFQARNGLSNAVIEQFKQAYPDLVLAAADIAAFQQINPSINVAIQSNGTGIVQGIDRVDLWVGGLAEQHINGGIVGQTFWVVLSEQFERLQDADRFYYISRFDDFDFYENFIDGQEFADIVARNTGMTDLPEHMFRTDELEDEDEDDDNAGNDDDQDEDDDTAGGDDDEDEDDDTSGEDDDEDDDEDEDEDEDDDTAGGGDDEDEDDDDDVTPPPPNTSTIKTGTPLADVLLGTSGDDSIVAFAGDDVAAGFAGADNISAGEGVDFVNGGEGNDTIFAGTGDDQVFGGNGTDRMFGDAGADRLFGEDGDDLITAGSGDDTVFGGAGNDLIVAEINDGNDVYFGEAGSDTLDMSAATTAITVNLGVGPLGNGTATGTQIGSDVLWGIENVNTGSGNDTIVASNAANVMIGGAGNDIFRFNTTTAANGDRVFGFEPGDRLDLSGIDANLGAAGNDAFNTILSGGSFTAAGQLLVTMENIGGVDFTVIQGNVNGDNAADFRIEVEGHHTVSSTNTNL